MATREQDLREWQRAEAETHEALVQQEIRLDAFNVGCHECGVVVPYQQTVQVCGNRVCDNCCDNGGERRIRLRFLREQEANSKLPF